MLFHTPLRYTFNEFYYELRLQRREEQLTIRVRAKGAKSDVIRWHTTWPGYKRLRFQVRQVKERQRSTDWWDYISTFPCQTPFSCYPLANTLYKIWAARCGYAWAPKYISHTVVPFMWQLKYIGNIVQLGDHSCDNTSGRLLLGWCKWDNLWQHIRRQYSLELGLPSLCTISTFDNMAHCYKYRRMLIAPSAVPSVHPNVF